MYHFNSFTSCKLTQVMLVSLSKNICTGSHLELCDPPGPLQYHLCPTGSATTYWKLEHRAPSNLSTPPLRPYSPYTLPRLETQCNQCEYGSSPVRNLRMHMKNQAAQPLLPIQCSSSLSPTSVTGSSRPTRLLNACFLTLVDQSSHN